MDQNAALTNSYVPDSGTTPVRDVAGGNAMIEVANKISEAKNVLVALSSDPSVDEMAAAIGLTIYLDRLGKRATAIYSGATPNALEFLEPEKAFEASADTLQDFVIALNKDKADHLRYKLDGDYVKIFITPYKARIDSRDLEFSYGDYNVDLVLALDVVNGADLDSALREHGRIMHDAAVVNITTGNPGKFGEIEWNDKGASSISEMIAKLLYSVGGENKIEKEDATAFLTGIVAATNRFSNAKTTPDTMQIASRLMESGANQQLVSKNITPDVDNELNAAAEEKKAVQNSDSTKLEIEHSKVVSEPVTKDSGNVADSEEKVQETVREVVESNDESESGAESELMKDLKEAAVSLAHAGDETVPERVAQPVKMDSGDTTTASVESELKADFGGTLAPETIPGKNENAPVVNEGIDSLPPVVPLNEGPMNDNNEVASSSVDYVGTSQSVGVPSVDTQTATQFAEGAVPEPQPGAVVNGMGNNNIDSGIGETVLEASSVAPVENANTVPNASFVGGSNPASMMAPQVSNTPEINGVPEMNYMPLPGQEILPPPPTPPLDMGDTGLGVGMQGSPLIAENNGQEMPSADLASTGTGADNNTNAPDTLAQPTSLGPQPAMQDQVYNPQAADPGAFKIPGMQ